MRRISSLALAALALCAVILARRGMAEPPDAGPVWVELHGPDYEIGAPA